MRRAVAVLLAGLLTGSSGLPGCEEGYESAPDSAAGRGRCSNVDVTCDDGRWCAFAGCEAPTARIAESYRCAPLPECRDGGRPVCGCDGQVYANVDCSIAATRALRCARADNCRYDEPLCAAPSGHFSCGPIFCRTDEEYCRITGCLGPEEARCTPLPPACESGDGCACFSDPGGYPISGCSGDAASGVTITALQTGCDDWPPG